MNWDPTSTKYFWRQDKYGFVVRQPHSWATEDNGKGDALGRTALAAMCFGFDFDYMQCVKVVDQHDLVIVRHPDDQREASRDHIALLMLYLWEERAPWVAADFAARVSNQSIGIFFDLWLLGFLDMKWAWKIWHIAMILQFMFVVPWNFLHRSWIRLLPDKYQHTPQKLLFPHYALFVFGWQMRPTPDWLGKRVLQWLARQDAHPKNMVIRALLGQPINGVDWAMYWPVTRINWDWDWRLATKVPSRKLEPWEFLSNDLDSAILNHLYDN